MTPVFLECYQKDCKVKALSMSIFHRFNWEVKDKNSAHDRHSCICDIWRNSSAIETSISAVKFSRVIYVGTHENKIAFNIQTQLSIRC